MAARDTQIGGNHYKGFNVQPWDAFESWMTREEFEGHLKISAIEYIARCRQKGGVEDIRKAIHTLVKCVEVMTAGVPTQITAAAPIPQPTEGEA